MKTGWLREAIDDAKAAKAKRPAWARVKAKWLMNAKPLR